MNSIRDSKIRSGFRVVGTNTADGRESCWYFPTREGADIFAKQLTETTGKEADVLKYLGSWRRSAPPVEFVYSDDMPGPTTD